MVQETSICDLPSNAQPRTSYPSGPSRGYVIDNATCIAWATRILKEPISPEVKNQSVYATSIVMQKVRGKPYPPFRGWKGMDPELIPKFEEGEREAVAKELLEAEGITQYEFRTELY
ncbi:hypothetical protein BYT27DRAFT_7226790 [Phlegmacium glaucopus]|nr:hypothetical protein BYT27DRAFT_7226790 [Phlegmacium glaucopus]